MRYRIWKASIEEYRIQEVATGEVRILKNFSLNGVKFCVDVNGFLKAKQREFKNTGDAFDYFAWMEASDVVEESGENAPLANTVFYNPFKHMFFRDRTTEKCLANAQKVRVRGNFLTYTA